MNTLDCNSCSSNSNSFLSFILTTNTTSIDLFGCGTKSNPLYAKLNISEDEGNILELRSDGVYVACCGDGSGGGDLNISDTLTLNLSGDGSTNDPILGDVNVSAFSGNTIQIFNDGLYVANTIQAGVVYGGIVTWLQDYDYYVSPSGYYINGNFYESPGGFFTLSAPDLIDNRLDTFIVDVNGNTTVLEGTPSSNPAQAALDPALQLELSIALVEVGTTEPTIDVECIYRNNLEWATITSSVLTLDPDSIITPCAGAKAIKGDNVVTGTNITFTRSSAFNPITLHSQLVMLIRSEAWISAPGNRLRVQWTLSGGAVASFVDIIDGTYGFDTNTPSTCQIVAIPLNDFALTPASSVDGLIITANATSGTLNFTLDDICIQGQPVPILPTPLDEKVKVSEDDTTPGYLDAKLTAGPGVVFTILNPGADESLEISSTDALTFDNALTRTLDNVQLGGTLLHNTTIDTTAAFSLTVSGDVPAGTGNGALIGVNNAAAGTAIYGTSNGVGSLGIQGISANGTGVQGAGTFGGVFTGTVIPLQALTVTDNTPAALLSGTYTTTGTSARIVSVQRHTTGVAGAGLGGTIQYDLENSTGGVTAAGSLGMSWVVPTSLSESSRFNLTLMDAGVTGRKLAVENTGQLILDEYGAGTFSGTPTFMLTTDVNGNIIEEALPSGATTPLVTADNGLTVNPAQNVQLGGTLLQNTTIDDSTFNLLITKVGAGNTLRTTATSGVGVRSEATTGGAIWGSNTSVSSAAIFGSNSSSGQGVLGTSSTGIGVWAQATGAGGVALFADTTDTNALSVAGHFVRQLSVASSTTRDIITISSLSDSSTAGHGGDIVYMLDVSTDSGQNRLAGRIGYSWTDATEDDEQSQFRLSVVDNSGGGPGELDALTIQHTGEVTLPEYGVGTFTGTPTFMLAVDANGNVIEESAAGLGLVYSVDNGLTENTPGNFRLGGTLVQNTTIDTDDFLRLILSGGNAANFNGVLHVDAVGNTAGINITSVDGGGIAVVSSNETAGSFESSGGNYAIVGRSNTDTFGAGWFLSETTLTNNVQQGILIDRTVDGGVGADGIGVSIDFNIETDAGSSTVAHRLISKWTTAANATRTSEFSIQTVNSTAQATKLTLSGPGALRLHQYGTGAVTAGAATFALNVDANGNVIESALGGAGFTNPMGATGDIIYSADGAGTPAALVIGGVGEVLTVSAGGLPEWSAAGVAGSVVSVSVVSANGFAGSVANPTTTPAITLSTTLTGLLQGNGTAMTAITNSVTVGQTLRVTGANTYAWGALNLSTAAAITGDLPLANLAQGTARSVLGVTGNATADYAPIQGTSNQVLVVNSAGTALTFGQLNLASVSAVTGILDEVNGGTGQSTFATGDILYASGVNTLAKRTAGTPGQVLTMAGGVPTWATLGGGSGTVTSVTGTANRITISGTPTIAPVVDIAATYVGQASITTLGTIATGVWSATAIAATRGGTGLTTVPGGAILRSTAANVWEALLPGTNGQVLTMNAGVAVWGTISGAGTVTSVNGSGGTTGLTLTGGPITSSGTLSLGGTLNAVNGGTGLISYSQGDLIYASATNVLAKLPKSITATRYLANTGAANNPAWAQVNLANGVTGTLPLASIAQGAAKSVLGVTGNVPAVNASIASTVGDTIFRTNSANTSVGWGSINLASANAVGTSVLAVVNGGTGIGTLISSRLLITTSTNSYTQATPTASNGITVTMGSGTMAISSTFNPARQTLVDTPPFTWNINNGESAVMTLTNVNRTLVITNPVAGRTYVVEVVQDGVGNRTVTTWPVGTLWEGGSAPTLSTAAAKRDLITFYYNGANYLGKLVGTFN